MKFSCSFLLALSLLVGSSLAQPPDSLWSRTYGGSSDDECYSVLETSDGGYILAGSTDSFGAGSHDFWLVKTNANGDSLWSRTFGGESLEGCGSVEQTADAGYALAGLTASFGAGGYDFWLVKTNSLGDSMWSRRFGGTDFDYCTSFLQTSDGGYILAGITQSFGAGGADFWLVKTDAQGDSLWSQTYGGSADDICFSVQQTADSGYILAGFTASFGAGSYDFWLVKTNGQGESLWSRRFGGVEEDRCHSVQQTESGYVLAGTTYSFGPGDWNFWLVKTDATGDSLWSRTFGGSGHNECSSVERTTDGGYVLIGETDSFGSGSGDASLVKTNSQGDSLWSRTFGGADWDWCHSVQQTVDGGYVLAGGTWSFGADSADFWLLKTGPELAAEPIGISLPSQYALHPNHPNPFNPSTRIAYDFTQTSNVSLTVFDLLGREVATLVHGVQPAGTHSVTFDGTHLPSGIYFYRLQAGDFVAARKMVLLK